MTAIRKFGTVVLVLTALSGCPGAFGKAKVSQDPQKARQDYIARMQQQTAPSPTNTSLGSLWQPDGLMNDLAADYKARRLNDLVTIVVVQQTSAQAAGNVNAQRDFNTQSGISGLAGHISTSGVTNLLTAQSSSKLKGQGSLDASSAMKTSLAGQIVAVLPNGTMVVEAHRLIVINNQKETMIVRGVLRPGDIGPNNTAFSTALSDLEIELKGKGVVSDATRPPNPLVRALLWLINF
jgi:flagellar L-ring protein precursor FlgH